MAVTASMVKELRQRTGLGMMECKKALKETDGDIELAIDNMRKASGLKAAKKANRTAADGVVVARVAEDGSYGILLEINSETDFAARDDNFLGFVGKVVDKAFAEKPADIASLMAGELEAAREALVQKIGENINVRRIAIIEADGGAVGAYVHSNKRIAAITKVTAGGVELGKDISMHVAATNPQVCRPEDMPADALEKEKEIIKAQPDMAGKPEEIVEKMMVGRVKKFLKEASLVDQPFVKNPDLTIAQLAKEAGAEVVGFTRFEVGEGIEVAEADFAAEVAATIAATKGE